MKTRQFILSVVILIALLAAIAGISQAQAPEPQGVASPQEATTTAFTYQGYLKDGGLPSNGNYDFRFILYDNSVGGSQVGSPLYYYYVPVTNGLFTLKLNFGAVFAGTRLWIEIAVRPAGGTTYNTLDPRQEITAAPYALYALRTDHLSAPDGDPTNALVVDNNGNVGVGTAAPGVKLEVNGDIKSSSNTIIAASPYDLRSWSNVSVIPSDQGYVYLQTSATGSQQVHLTPTLPAIVFGVRQKLAGVTVCYQLDNAASYITKTEAFFSTMGGERVFMFEDETDRTSTTFGCYDYFDPSPDNIVGTVVIRLWLNYAGTGWPHEIVIGRITLWLTEN
jgi:hypothetical protein